MLRAPLLRTATWILASTALFALGCGDDTSETTTTGQGGEGSGGDDAKASSGTPSSSASNSASTGATPQSSSASSGGDGGSGAGDPGPGPSSGGGGTGGIADACGNGELDQGEECHGGASCDDECHIVIEPGCNNGVLEEDLDEEYEDGNEADSAGCPADRTTTPAVVP